MRLNRTLAFASGLSLRRLPLHLAVAAGGELYTEPSPWRALFRLSAMAGAAPNKQLGDARNHTHCRPLMPLAVVHCNGLAFFLRLPFPPAAPRCPPCPPHSSMPLSLALAPAPLRGAERVALARPMFARSQGARLPGDPPRRCPIWQRRLSIDRRCGACRCIWRSRLDRVAEPTMFVARTASHFSDCGEGAQRPRSAGPRAALRETMRTALRGLRCNALLGGLLAITPPLLKPDPF